MLIIFDLDDTLIDTTNRLTPIILLKTLKVMIKKGLKIDDEKRAYQKILKIDKTSIGSKQTIKKFLYEQKADKNFYDIAINSMYLPLDGDIKIFTLHNAIDVLKYLSERHSLALVSQGAVKLQFDKMEKAGIDRAIFSKIVITKVANKGFYYKKIMDELGYKSNNTYVCGDKIEVDLVPAKELGCITICMNWGRKKNINKTYVDYTINSLEEVKKILDEKLR
ncbi:MAG: hypothetical protein K940chlam1_00463 [Candidatus Anoxychlamydiales bacterium]|nr:hypothetical protein [Candidatus Anoxychlamydiales bacterium]NGX36375.1 hypothetical protein [Candidatus Anoxychlamydiales bacterium]